MIGILIIARLGSTRLANKHLIEVQGRTMLEWCVLRIKEQFKNELSQNKIKIIIATSKKSENQKFLEFTNNLKIDLFFGDNTNIPLRQKECADFFNLKSIISVDGDDILCSTEAMRKVYNLLFVENYISTTGLPIGMNSSGYSVSLLSECLRNHQNLEVLETGWGIIFKNVNKTIYHYENQYEISESIRMTLDYEKDSDFFKSIINHLNEDIISISDNQLLEIILSLNFHKINNHLDKEYWENFNNQKSKLI